VSYTVSSCTLGGLERNRGQAVALPPGGAATHRQQAALVVPTMKDEQCAGGISSQFICHSVLIGMTVNAAPGHVYYLGQIDAVLRARQEGEPIAQRFPLIDAGIVGYSRGTWEVTIRDNYGPDMELIRSKYPSVQGVKVDKQILPAWARPKS